MQKKPIFKSEADLISWIQRHTPQRSPGLTLGIGDDAAVFSVPSDQEVVITTDMTIEGVHFKRDLHPPQAVGHRALARSLSDIAAMGGTPRYALISLALSRDTGQSWAKSFISGLSTIARRFDVAVIGGDSALSPGPTTIDVIVTGEVPRGRALLRSGAKSGDLIFVSGRLGFSALGLRLILARQKGRNALEKSALRAHLFPEPQCALGQFLSEHRLSNSMMDLSDGLSIDLARLCQSSGVGASLFAAQIPMPDLSDRDDALKLALHGGEDYQLLFTVSPRKLAKMPHFFDDIPLHCIGKIESRKGIRLIAPDGKSLPLQSEGWDHFARRLTRKITSLF